MIRSSGRRSLRRTTAVVAGTALVAAGLGLGAAPAQAADSVVSGTMTDTQGNAVDGYVDAYRQQTDGSFIEVASAYAHNGYFARTLADGVYKFAATTYEGGYTEFYRDKADLASADAVTVGGGATVLQPWTVDQPYVVGAVTDPSGRPVQGIEVTAYDAASGDRQVNDYTDEKGAFVLAGGYGPGQGPRDGNVRLASEWYNDKADFATADAVTGTPAGNVARHRPHRRRVHLRPRGQRRRRAAGARDGEQRDALATSRTRTASTSSRAWRPGAYKVQFRDDLDEYTSEYFDNAATAAAATPVTVGKDQAVGNINASLTPAAPAPAASVELTGTVKDDAGAPVVGAYVVAYDTPNAPAKEHGVSYARSNRAGVYAFDDLDEVAGENQFKIEAEPAGVGDDNGFGLFGSWLGGQTDYDRATTVTITPGTPIPGGDITLMRAGGIEGVLTGATGLPFSGSVQLLSVDGVNGGSTSTKADNTFEIPLRLPGHLQGALLRRLRQPRAGVVEGLDLREGHRDHRQARPDGQRPQRRPGRLAGRHRASRGQGLPVGGQVRSRSTGALELRVRHDVLLRVDDRLDRRRHRDVVHPDQGADR